MPPPAHPALQPLLNAAMAHVQAGRLADAEAALRKVLSVAPDHAGAAYNLAVALKALGRLDEAVGAYRRALDLRPDNAKAHNNLGALLASQAHGSEAESHYRQALRINPDYANAHYNLANLLRKQAALPAAIHHYQQALKGAPGDADTHNNLGLALAADGRTQAAIDHFLQALALRPDDAEAHSNLGAALMEQGRVEEAMSRHATALALDPGHANAHFNLGHALYLQDRPDEAEAAYRRCIALDPRHAEAQNNLGFLAQSLGRLDEALERYAKALALKPGYVDAHWNQALARLSLGDFERGWPEYEWRWRRPRTPPPALPAPPWDGSDLAGRTILLHAEQGQGDTIQFVRYAALVKARGARVILRCPSALQPLLAGVAGVDALAPEGAELPPIDCHTPLLSLPGLLGTRLQTIPADVPYLAAAPAAVDLWRQRLAGLARPRVGLAWRGNPAHENDRRRSIAAATIATLTTAAPVDWVSLQLDAGPDDLAALGAPAFDFSPWQAGWSDTAALVQALDLVVTVDTAIAHLAGALGKPVWVLLPFFADWRWLLGRADSPWYPTMTLYRQPAPGDWAAVLSGVRADLERWMG